MHPISRRGITSTFIVAVIAACIFPASASATQLKSRELAGGALVVELASDKPSVQSAQNVPGDFVRVGMTGLPALREAGRPELPYRTFLVAIPEGSRAVLRTRAFGSTVIGTARVAPVMLVAAPGFDGAAPEIELRADLEDLLDPAVYEGASRYPRVLAEIAATGLLRDQPVAEVRIYPVQYDPSNLRIVHHARIEVHVSFVRDEASRTTAPLRLDPTGKGAPKHLQDFGASLSSAVINPGMMQRDRAARHARQAVSEPALASSPAAFDAALAGEAIALGGSPGSVKISVTTDGLFQISPADLTAAGVIVSTINPQTFHMTSGGSDIPVIVEGEGDGVFSGADRVIFHGTGIKGNRYTVTNVYWLSYGGTAGPRMTTDSGAFTGAGTTLTSFLTTAHAELNLNYTLRNRVGVVEHWYWGLHFTSAPANYTINTPRVAAAAHTLAVRASMLGLTSADHTPTLKLNTTQIALDTFSGQVTFVQSAAPASSLLLSGNNTLNLAVTGGINDQVASDFFEIDYRRTYVVDNNQLMFDAEGSGTFRVPLSNLGTNDLFLVDVTAPLAAKRISIPPAQITGAGPFTATFEDIIAADRSYVISTRSALKTPVSIVEEIPSSLHTAANGADYIVVTDRSFAASLAPLVAHRQAQGLRTKVAFTDDIYDEFNFGIFSPEAIKSFLTYAYASWTAPAPAFVLLAGDGHIDYSDNLGSGDPQLVPPLLSIFPSFGESPADNSYAAVAGSDVFPEMAVGRLPARNTTDIDTMVANILAYENNPPVAALNQQSLFVADNNDTIFQAILNNLAVKMPSTMMAATAYLPGGDTDPNFPPPTPQEIASTTLAVVEGFDDGSLVATYLGHGNVSLWASEKLWEHMPNPPTGQAGRLDLNRLSGTGKQSFLMALNCINGYWVDFVGAGAGHQDHSLAEHFVLRPAEGAIAAWAPSALGQLSDYDGISNEVFIRIFQDRVTTLGPALVTSLVNAVNIYSVTTDNVEGMTLFGDPATRLALDTDADGLVDWRETSFGSNPLDGDSDDDGLADGVEVLVALSSPTDSDSDNDGLFDGTERGVTAPVNGTNVGAGQFVADADPLTTTDPADADTDNGGTADGAEDTNHNGRIDAGETDPNDPSDDLACGGPLPEVTNLTVTRSGNNIVLSWDSVQTLLPCASYKVYAAPNANPKSSFAPFVDLGDVSSAGFTHVGAGTGTTSYDYLVRVVHPSLGLGPLGHYGQ